jgi:hypothetical protein
VTDTAISPPRTVVYASYAAFAWGALNLVTGLVQLSARSYLKSLLLKNDNKLATSKQQGYSHDPGKLNHAVSTYLTTGLVFGAVFCALIIVLALQLRKGRGYARWALVVLNLLPLVVGLPIGVIAITQVGAHGMPAGDRISTLLTALAAVATLVFMFMPDSARFFAANKPAPAAGGRAGGGGLFAPRPRPGQQPGGSPAANADARPPMGLRALFAPRPAPARNAATPNLQKGPNLTKNPSASDGAEARAIAKAKGRTSADGAGRDGAVAPTRPVAARPKGKAKGR